MAEEAVAAAEQAPPPENTTKNKKIKLVAILFLACIIGYGHSKYVSQVFENTTNFSHLSRLEREMVLRTEMGFYYSFFKTVVEEPTFVLALGKLMYNKLLEYPNDLNAFNRFNIHPELIIGSVYRQLEPWMHNTTQCYTVDRGEGVPPVESCYGIAVPVLFYLQAVWIMAGVTAAAIFIYGIVISNTVLGGLLAIVHYLVAHSNATRVMWHPNERENFAQPLLLLQMCLLTIQLRTKPSVQAGVILQIAICILNCLCLLFWQFSQFIFLTQTAIFFLMVELRIIDFRAFGIFLLGHYCSLHTTILLLEGNEMLKTSYFTSFFAVVSIYCVFLNKRMRVVNKKDLFFESLIVTLRLFVAFCMTLSFKGLTSQLLGVKEDKHIWDIFLSKVSNYRNFHTMLYTCSDVFDFMPKKEWIQLINGGQIPVAVFGIIFVVLYWCITKKVRDVSNKDYDEKQVKEFFDKQRAEELAEEMGETDLDVTEARTETDAKVEPVIEEKSPLVDFIENMNIDAGILYNILQMSVFGFLAAMVMRLKLLFVPHLCIVSALVMNPIYFPRRFRGFVRNVLYPVMIGLALFMATNTTTKEINAFGEFSDIEQENLLEWIAQNTSTDAVFAASMPLTSSIVLSTRRAVVNHPHYENAGARQRNYAVYKMYSKFPSHELYLELTKLKVSHLVVERMYCYGKSSRGCTLEQIWDVEAPKYKTHKKLCERLLDGHVDHFYRVYSNSKYSVFKIHDYSVNYMPRTLDT